MSDIGERLKLVIREKGKSARAMAKLCNIPYTTFWKYLSGERKPSSLHLQKICTHLAINLNWLITGEGEIFVQKSPSDLNNLRANNEKQGILEKIYAMLKDMEQEELNDILKHLEKEKRLKDLEKRLAEILENKN